MTALFAVSESTVPKIQRQILRDSHFQKLGMGVR